MPPKLSPGLYEKLITEALGRLLDEQFDAGFVERDELDRADAHVLIARHLYREVERSLGQLAGDTDQQVALANRILETVRQFTDENADAVVDPPQALHAIGAPHRRLADAATVPPRPSIPLSSSDLLVNAKNEPRVGQALKGEIQSADRIDLLCAFIRWHGLRILRDELGEHLRERDRPLRVLTTTYMGATERKALDVLVEPRLCIDPIADEPRRRLAAARRLRLRHRRRIPPRRGAHLHGAPRPTRAGHPARSDGHSGARRRPVRTALVRR